MTSDCMHVIYAQGCLPTQAAKAAVGCGVQCLASTWSDIWLNALGHLLLCKPHRLMHVLPAYSSWGLSCCAVQVGWSCPQRFVSSQHCSCTFQRWTCLTTAPLGSCSCSSKKFLRGPYLMCRSGQTGMLQRISNLCSRSAPTWSHAYLAPAPALWSTPLRVHRWCAGPGRRVCHGGGAAACGLHRRGCRGGAWLPPGCQCQVQGGHRDAYHCSADAVR